MDGKKRGETKNTQKIGKTNETKWASKSSSITRLQDCLEDSEPRNSKKHFIEQPSSSLLTESLESSLYSSEKMIRLAIWETKKSLQQCCCKQTWPPWKKWCTGLPKYVFDEREQSHKEYSRIKLLTGNALESKFLNRYRIHFDKGSGSGCNTKLPVPIHQQAVKSSFPWTKGNNKDIYQQVNSPVWGSWLILVIVGSSSCGYILRWAIPYPDAKDIQNIEYSYSHQLRSPYPVVYLNLCPDKTTSPLQEAAISFYNGYKSK